MATDTTRVKLFYHTGGSQTHPPSSSSVMVFQVRSIPPASCGTAYLTNIFIDCVDMSAARHADVLFVKKKPGADNDLAAYCTREGIPHVFFEDFDRALKVVKRAVEGELTTKEALALGTA